jgi:cobalamin-dependent methionine synthase I
VFNLISKEEYVPIEGLSIIGESINDSIPSTHEFFEKDDIDSIQNLAKLQAENGAKYIDVNVGKRDSHFMAHIVKRVQEVVDIPISIDSPDFELQKAGLGVYNIERAKGAKPIVNSISELRMDLFELIKIKPFCPVLIASERSENGKRRPNKSGVEIKETAKRLIDRCREDFNIMNNEIIVDPGLGPIGADKEGMTRTSLEGMRYISQEENFKGIHISVGLSNFTQMLPSKTKSGKFVKTPLESAFLTLAMPVGLDFIVGNPKKKYRILENNHAALIALKKVIKASGLDSVIQLQYFLMN